MSAFVWLNYSERERRKMLDVVDLFGEHDTRDELGIGSVRDAFFSSPGHIRDWSGRVSDQQKWRLAPGRRSSTFVEPIERSDNNDGNIGKVAKTAAGGTIPALLAEDCSSRKGEHRAVSCS